jgi:superfamily II DNA or RNA helicase
MRRGRGQRILTITTKSMMTQFQQEFWHRFTIPLVRLDSQKIQRIRQQLPGNHNPFHYFDRTIISVDTLKQDREYRSFLEKAHWDIIIIDEAHNVARRHRGEGASLRAKLAERLAKRSDTLIMLSATPHDGRPESFASLMNMLDPTAIANEANYTKEDIRQLYIRRFKKDVQQDLKKYVPERRVESVEANASAQEEKVFATLADLQLGGQSAKGTQLFKTTLLKALLSSPMACLETVENRLKRLQKKTGKDADTSLEIGELSALLQDLKAIAPAHFSKYQRLVKLIREDFAWTGKDPRDRLVIFTGRLKTVDFLETQLSQDLGLNGKAIAVLDGGMSDTDQMKVVEGLGQEQSPIRILIATEVASEGLNLHYLSHKLIHFDIPWSLMTLQQRNGRIDRYGQTRQPEIRYMLTRSQVDRMDEVERIIQVLLRKDEQAMLNIGDPSVFMGMFDPEREEQFTEMAIATGQSAEEFEATLDQNASSGGEFDIFAWFEEDTEAAHGTDHDVENTPPVQITPLPSLFASDFEYTVMALTNLENVPPNLSINKGDRLIELQFPKDLEVRYARLPDEIKPKDHQLLQLCDRPERIMQEMEIARRQENTWSRVEYLWELHPLLDWLNDRNLFRFGRQEAPVIDIPEGLNSQESVFIFFANFPNQRGAPILTRWVSVCFAGANYDHTETLETTLQRTYLGQKIIPNRGQQDVSGLMDLRQLAVEKAKTYMTKERSQFAAQLEPALTEQLERLKALKGRHYEQLDLQFQDLKQSATKRQQQQANAQYRINNHFEDYQRWIKTSMTMEQEPFLKLVTVLRDDR